MPSRHVRVILRADIRGVGRTGEVKDVAAGYVRNFLLPRGLAMLATASALKRWEAERERLVAQAEAARQGAKAVAERMGSVSCKIVARAGQEGKLFGSVTPAQIVDVLSVQGFTVGKRQIELPAPIKMVGIHEVRVHLHPEVTIRVNLEVLPEEQTS